MGRHLSPRYGQVILISGYPVLTAVNWSQPWCTMCVQYQSSCAPKLAEKSVIEHWLPCGADGRAVYGHVITNFSGMGRFTYPWCSSGALRAPKLRYQSFYEYMLGVRQWRHVALRPGAYCVSGQHTLSLRSVNHEQFSMQMTQNDKLNKWLKILAGKEFPAKPLWRTPT